jgi:hypothetical protein
MEQKAVFHDLKCCILEYGTDMTTKRAKIFIDILCKNGASIFDIKKSKITF